MTLAPLRVACPQCGSADVVYSCKPECCFNHVCNHCYTTFELATTQVGEVKEDFATPPDPDPSGPTAPCARCGEARVFAIRDEPAPYSARPLGPSPQSTGRASTPTRIRQPTDYVAPPHTVRYVAPRYLCVACKALLTLEFTEIAPG